MNKPSALDNGFSRRDFMSHGAKTALALGLCKAALAQPSDPYDAYRDGIVKRHILCSGRYLSELWLKEFDPASDSQSLLAQSRSLVCAGVVPGQSEQLRRYIPWLSPDGIVYGGGENPLLKGGLAMAAFSLEAMATNNPSSLRHAELLFRYFEASELRLASGEETGFFLRCDNINNLSGLLQASGGLGFHASMDELSGLVLGLYYFYLASRDAGQQGKIRELARRLGQNLKQNGFLLIGPGATPVIQKGFSGAYMFQWPLQQALQRITGDRFEPSTADYRAASDTLWEIYLNADERIRRADRLELLAIMYLWARFCDLEPSAASRWVSAFRAALPASIAEQSFFKAAFFDLFSGDVGAAVGQFASDVITNANVDVEALRSPLTRYVATLAVQGKIIYFGSTANWFNHSWAFHTLHYALDREVNGANNSLDAATRVAVAGNQMAKYMLCGERVVPSAAIPFDNDFYAAVMVKGLLSRFVPLQGQACPLVFPFSQPYSERVNQALAARTRMWSDLPVDRRHNNATPPKIGEDFCWESGPGDEGRVLRAGTHPSASGMNEGLLEQAIASGHDVVFEAGGLDYFFPRALMAYWLGQVLQFTDGAKPLRAVACLPSAANGRYQRATCASHLSPAVIQLLCDE